MAGLSKGISELKRSELQYEGFQAKDFIKGLLERKGVMQIDVANMIGVAPKTVSQWVTGVTFPNRSAIKSLILALAPGHDDVLKRQSFIDENMAVYDSIRQAYLDSKRKGS